jgi:hypothetical protein
MGDVITSFRRGGLQITSRFWGIRFHKAGVIAEVELRPPQDALFAPYHVLRNLSSQNASLQENTASSI